MGTVHKLIERVGRQEALRAATTTSERRAIEAALSYMADEEAGVGFLVLWLVPSRIAPQAVTR